jgi:hypothetical protein
MHTTKPTTSLPKKKQQQQQQNKRQRPSIAEIERAIGAGRYRDIDARHVPLLPSPQIQHFPSKLFLVFEVLLLIMYGYCLSGSDFWGFFVAIISELKEEEVANFDFISMSFTGMFEGPVEKKLRETGEWLTTSTESRFRASGNHYSTPFLLLKFL